MQKHIDKNGVVFEGLEVNVCDVPWRHLECTSPKLKEICRETYNFFSRFSVRDNVVHETVQANTGMILTDSYRVLPNNIIQGDLYITMVCNYLLDTYYTDKIIPGAKWNISACEATMVNEAGPAELETAILYPHSDNPEDIIKENRLNGLDETIYIPGTVKLVLYTGDDSLNYDDYGTKLYTKKTEPFEDISGYSGFNLIKEVTYANGKLFMWAPGPDTWHGTDYCSHLDNRRIFYTGEYYKVHE